jgi:Fur family ferric uptake transcriptional regulator
MDKCSARELLEANDLKVTKQREILLDEIIKTGVSFSANSLFKKLINSMDLVTIYRILNVLSVKKIIREVFCSDEARYYELSCVHNPVHPHFICGKCKEVFCLKELRSKDMLNLKKYAGALAVEDVSVMFAGTCSGCM